MNEEKIRILFGGIVADSVIDEIFKDYPLYADVPLEQLGVSSLGIMELVAKMETEFLVQIDYRNFRIADIGTVRKIGDYLHRPAAE